MEILRPSVLVAATRGDQYGYLQFVDWLAAQPEAAHVTAAVGSGGVARWSSPWAELPETIRSSHGTTRREFPLPSSSYRGDFAVWAGATR